MSDLDVYDVVVIGAGVVGASCAHHLAERGLNVAVVEAQGGHAEGSTGLSFASVRAQWADEFNIEVSWRSIQRWRDFEATYGIDIGYRPNGYLLLFPEHIWEAQLKAVDMQRALGVPVDVLTLEQAQERVRFDPTGLAGATWGPADGQIDPHAATGAFLSLAKANGATVSFRFPVDRIESRSDGSWAVGSGAQEIVAQHVVNAAGGWGRDVAALAGFEVPVVHARRNIFASAEGFATTYVPMTVDFGTGLYLRSEGTRLLFGGTRPGEVDGFNTALDWDWVEGLFELGLERFPWLTEVPLDRSASWAGTYENTPDHDAIVGPEPTAPTWLNACGLSGHGLMQAPEIGRMVAEEIADGYVSSYDMTRLSIERFRSSGSRDQSISLVF